MIGPLISQLAQTVASGIASCVQSPAGQHFIHQGIHIAGHKALEGLWENRVKIAGSVKEMLGFDKRPSSRPVLTGFGADKGLPSGTSSEVANLRARMQLYPKNSAMWKALNRQCEFSERMERWKNGTFLDPKGFLKTYGYRKTSS